MPRSCADNVHAKACAGWPIGARRAPRSRPALATDPRRLRLATLVSTAAPSTIGPVLPSPGGSQAALPEVTQAPDGFSGDAEYIEVAKGVVDDRDRTGRSRGGRRAGDRRPRRRPQPLPAGRARQGHHDDRCRPARQRCPSSPISRRSACPPSLRRVIVTHHHVDHVGGLPEVVAASGAESLGPSRRHGRDRRRRTAPGHSPGTGGGHARLAAQSSSAPRPRTVWSSWRTSPPRRSTCAWSAAKS